MIRNIFTLAAAVSILMACSSNNGSTYINITSPEDVELIVYELNPKSADPIDTVSVIANETYNYELAIDTANFHMITLANSLRAAIFVEPGDDISIDITKDAEKYNYEVSGSKESERIKRIVAKVEATNEAYFKMTQQLQSPEAAMAMADSLQKDFQKKFDTTKNALLAMIDENPGSISNLFIYPQSVARAQLVSAEENFEYYEKVGNALKESYPSNKHVPFFNETLTKMKEQLERSRKFEETQKNIAPGKPVPEISMNDKDGNPIALSDLRGKVVLIDFWAAWCRPCRSENPNLVKTYKDYKDKGFTIYSVSLDGLPQQANAKAEWLAAIEQDGLIWENHVSDLKSWNSPVVDQFGFQGIPYTVLIDQEGTIIGTNLRGMSLRAKLAEVFGDA